MFQSFSRRQMLKVTGGFIVGLGAAKSFLRSMRIDPASAQSGSNPIVIENSKIGNPSSEWDIDFNTYDGVGDRSIQGFATTISVNKGETVSFKIKTDAPLYNIDIYRLGYYQGMGARKIATLSSLKPQQQPECIIDDATGLYDCGNWAVSASWKVPSDATSGIFLAKLIRPDTGGASHMVFIVRDDARRSDLLFQTSDTTWQAYNYYGGRSLYGFYDGQNFDGDVSNRAYKVSYNRPFFTRINYGGQDWLFNGEYPMVRWLEANGYDVTYSTGVDTERSGQLITNHKVFLSVGHDEYWSGKQRANVEAAVSKGVHLAFFSGNEIFWKIRWENSTDGSQTPYRTLVCYKETQEGKKLDPLDPPTWTGTWRDPRFSPPADGGRPENALTGTIFKVNATNYSDGTGAITVPANDGKMRFWRNTKVAAQSAGKSITLAPGTLGYEWDEDLDNGFRPAGLIRLSTTTTNVQGLLLDYGATYGPGKATHHLTLYRHKSGALVFSAGTVQWSWGLDTYHDEPYWGQTTDIDMQQATVNLFADMNVQPATPQDGLVRATASTDTKPPTSKITSPKAGSTLPINTSIKITGTATDVGGGVVGGVEVSIDGGKTWHPATGRASWSYTWTPRAAGNVNIKSRAVDDSGNLETPSTGVTITIK